METKLHEINVTLSRSQKEEIFNAFITRKKILLSLSKDAFSGNDTLLVPSKSLKWNKDHCVSDKETFPESFKWRKEHFMLDEKLFSEMLENGYNLIPSMNDEGLENFRLYIPPTVVERLEQAREHKFGLFQILLDYSSLTKLEKYSILKNIGKLMENISYLRIYED